MGASRDERRATCSTSGQANVTSIASSRPSKPGASSSLGAKRQTPPRRFVSALAVWRGPALADVLYEPFAQEEAARLEDRRTMALEERIEADLELGRSAELVPELEKIVREHPHRERPLLQLMRALYRAGRQAEALSAYQAGRRRLADELGLEPGPELQELQRKILDHDPILAAARPPPALAATGAGPPPQGKRRRLQRGRLVIASAALAAVVGGASWMMLGTDGTGAANDKATSSKLVSLGSGAHAVELDGAPAAMAAGMARSGSRNRAKDG